LPVQACTTVADTRRCAWSRCEPDDWFIIGEQGEQAALVAALRLRHWAPRHAAVTDVSGGYLVVSL
jgi:heterotetrameric sarcosine oxidase gamma subunit